jgi:ssDNA-binding replication factor A large subunit
MLTLENMVKEISEKSGLKEKEVQQLIEEKQLELSGLVSSEGAAYIIGREFGINLLNEKKTQLKIKNILTGMRNVELIAKILLISKPRNFEKNGKKGTVINLVLGDETGSIRLSLWDNEIGFIENISVNDAISLESAYVKEDSRNGLELRLGKRGKISKVEAEIDAVEIKREDVKRKNIADLSEGEYAEIKANLIRLFTKNPFFEVCPKCGTRMEKNGIKFTCKQHGESEPEYRIVVSGVFDDGTSNIRVTFFKDAAEKLFGKKTSELREIAMKSMNYSAIYENFKGLGEDYLLRGRVKKNDFSGEIEFIANDISEVDVKKECESLLKTNLLKH